MVEYVVLTVLLYGAIGGVGVKDEALFVSAFASYRGK